MKKTSRDGGFKLAVGQKWIIWSFSLCAHDDMNIFQPILLFDSFILPADIIFHYFRQWIKSVTFDIAQYTPNVSPVANYAQLFLCQNAMIVILKTFRKMHVVSYMLNNVWFYCGASWFSYTGESPCRVSLFSQLAWGASSIPQSEVHALLDKKMNATAMGSIIINEKWHHCVVCLTAISPLSLQHSMWSRCLFD